MTDYLTVYASTGGITVDTRIELYTGKAPATVSITLGPDQNITLDFEDVAGLERLRDLATEGLVAMLEKPNSAVDAAADEPAGGAR